MWLSSSRGTMRCCELGLGGSVWIATASKTSHFYDSV